MIWQVLCSTFGYICCITFAVHLQNIFNLLAVHLQYTRNTLEVHVHYTCSIFAVHLHYTCSTLAVHFSIFFCDQFLSQVWIIRFFPQALITPGELYFKILFSIIIIFSDVGCNCIELCHCNPGSKASIERLNSETAREPSFTLTHFKELTYTTTNFLT